MQVIFQNKTIVVAKQEIANIVRVVLNSDNILEVKWDESLAEIEKEHLISLTRIVKELGDKKKMLVYIDTYNFMPITPEARIYAGTAEASEYTLANAVLVDSLPKKILFNFFIKINKPVVPTKGFSDKEEAMKWLNQFQL